MEPRIQYAKTSDGVNIAYTTLGEGAPVFWLADPPWSNLRLEGRILDLPVLAQRRMVVRFDARGLGLSDREVEDLTLQARCHDIEAVANALGLWAFHLVGVGFSGALAVAYAAGHGECVSRIALVNAFARAADVTATPQARVLIEMLTADWEMFTENLGALTFGWGRKRSVQGAEFVRASVTQEGLQRGLQAISSADVSAILPRISAPTLVIQHGGLKFLSMEQGRELAAAIPNARLAVLEGTWAGGNKLLFETIDQFLGESDEPTELPALPSGTAIILFADIAGSTALTERLGDAAFREKARDLDTTLRTIIRERSGTPIEGKLLGDGVLAVFTSARQAIEAALACGRAGDDASLPLHLGLHAGDVIRESDPDGRANVYGGAVNIASRISGLSAPGEVLVSETVRSLARTSAGVQFEDRGEQALKGVGEKVRVWSAREGG